MRFARAFYIYTAGSFVAGAVPIFLLPVLTRHLSDADFGLIAAITTLITFATPPLIWGTTALVAVEYGRQPIERFRVYFSSMLRLPLASFAVLLLIALASAPFAAMELSVPASWIVTVPVFALLSLLPQLLLQLLRMRDEPWVFASFEIINAFVLVSFSFFLVVTLGIGWEGRVLALAASTLFGSAIAIWWMGRNGYITFEFDVAYLKDAFKFGAGLVPHDLGNQAVRFADRLVLIAMVGLSGAGQYAVAAQVASIMLTVLASFNRAWTPYLFAQLREGRPGAHEAIVKKSYMVIGCAVIFFIAFNAAVPSIYRIFIDEKFSVSMNYVLWLTLGYLFMAVYMTYVDYIFYVKKTRLLSLVTIFNLTCNVALNYLLIDRYGVIGAAYAFAATMFLVMLIAFFLSKRVHPMPWFHWMRKWR